MKKTTNYLFVAIVLGLGWAMRGHFGHEWGAAWAGAMGALAVLIVSKRKVGSLITVLSTFKMKAVSEAISFALNL